MDTLIEKARTAIIGQELIPRGSTVVAALSGGADSVALLHVLSGLREELCFSLAAAHLNHCIRPGEADEDESFAGSLCAALDIPIIVERIDVPAIARREGKSLEQAAREQRYAFFERAMLRFGACRTAVAHHMDDQAESVLLHLIRGSGGAGLTGMKYRRGSIIRPLLGARRQEIESFLAARSLSCRTDSTNLMRDASRNRIRLDVIPYISQHLNPAFVESICSAARLLEEDEAYLSKEASDALAIAFTGSGYDRRYLASLPFAVRSRALRLALSREGAATDIELRHIRLLDGLLTARTGAALDLPHISVHTSNDELRMGRPPQRGEGFEAPFSLDGRTPFPGGYMLAARHNASIVKDGSIAFMDLDRLPGGLTLRSRRPGDRFFPAGAPGSKKLKDFFIDKKVPREQRDMPVLFHDRDALFVPGHGIAESVKVTDATERILRITVHRDPS